MKFFVAAAAAAIATTTVSAEQCVVAQLTSQLLPLAGPAADCQAIADYTIILPTTMPNAKQLEAICSKCTDLISTAKTVTFPTCTLKVDGKDVSIDSLFNEIVGKCGSSSGSNSTSPSAAPNATTAAPAATTAAPVATTVAPAKSGSASSGSGASATITKAPATTTPAPTTAAPKSAGVSATIGAAVAVACSIAAFVL